MQLPIGFYYHKTLEREVEVTEMCIELSKRAPMDVTSCFVKDEDDIKEVTASLLIPIVKVFDKE